MLFGPIAPLELTHRAQRLRFRIVVVAYATLLWLILCGTYLATILFNIGGGSINESTLFATWFFVMFTYSQLIVSFFVTPAYTADAIALEKERQTLEYLLTTELGTWEIVLGKFAVRFLQIVLVQLAGLPVLTFAAWLGGISPPHIAMAYALSGALTMMLAGLSMLISVLTMRVRDAVLGTYIVALSLMWVLPALARAARLEFSPWLDWLEVIENVLRTNPFAALGDVLAGNSGSEESGAWAVAGPALRNYSLFGVASLLLAGWLMRPVYLRQRFGAGRSRRLRSWSKRRPVPDDPIFWREQTGHRPGWLGRLGQVVVALGCVGLVVTTGFFTAVIFWERWSPSSPDGAEAAARDLNGVLRWWGTLMASLILLAVAIRAATAITGEREARTLDPLLVTPLQGWELLKGKLLGCLWAVRWPAAALALAWLLGVAAGALSSVALVVLAIEMIVYAALAAAVGLACSLRLSGSGWALAVTAAVLLLDAAAFVLCCVLWPFLLPASPPAVLAFSAFRALPLSGDSSNAGLLILASVLVLEVTLWLVAYLLITAGLVFYAVRSFDRLVGRAYAPRGPTAAQTDSALQIEHARHEPRPGNVS